MNCDERWHSVMNEREPCPRCRREYYRNYDGTMRKHDCQPAYTHDVCVRLRSGGSVRIFGNFDIFTLGRKERALVATLADRVQAYAGEE